MTFDHSHKSFLAVFVFHIAILINFVDRGPGFVPKYLEPRILVSFSPPSEFGIIGWI